MSVASKDSEPLRVKTGSRTKTSYVVAEGRNPCQRQWLELKGKERKVKGEEREVEEEVEVEDKGLWRLGRKRSLFIHQHPSSNPKVTSLMFVYP